MLSLNLLFGAYGHGEDFYLIEALVLLLPKLYPSVFILFYREEEKKKFSNLEKKLSKRQFLSVKPLLQKDSMFVRKMSSMLFKVTI